MLSSISAYAIKNGVSIRHLDNPHMVHLTQGSSHCSGVRLSRNYVVTAAHCIQKGRFIRVKWYENGRSKTQSVRVNTIKIFSRIYSKELAVIPITGGPYRALAIHDYRLLRKSDRWLYNIYGFGMNANSDRLGVLRKGSMVFNSHYNYQRVPMLEFTRNGSKGNNPCQGDSGGPVLLENKNEKKLIGIISFIRSSKQKIRSGQDQNFICRVADRGYYIPLSLYEKDLAPYL